MNNLKKLSENITEIHNMTLEIYNMYENIRIKDIIHLQEKFNLYNKTINTFLEEFGDFDINKIEDDNLWYLVNNVIEHINNYICEPITEKLSLGNISYVIEDFEKYNLYTEEDLY